MRSPDGEEKIPVRYRAFHPRPTYERMTIIDIHCHLATPASRLPVEPYRRPEHEPYDYFMGPESAAHTASMVHAIMPALTEPAARIEHMDRMGIERDGGHGRSLTSTPPGGRSRSDRGDRW